jgi:serine/threonine protein kinase
LKIKLFKFLVFRENQNIINMYTSNDGKPMIKNYLVRETLGKGSFGTVVKAISQPDQKVVAIKIMDTSKM